MQEERTYAGPRPAKGSLAVLKVRSKKYSPYLNSLSIPATETASVGSSNAEAEAKRKFNETYIKISEESLISTDKLAVEDATVKVKRAYCPHCGKEIVSKLPSMWNPYTGEKICRYDCECGFKANLEYTYPRLIILDKDGNELDIQF